MVITVAMTATSASTKASSIRLVALASLIGTTIEWYDFYLYGTAAALVFNRLYFPTLDPLTGTLAAFGTYSVGFFARPIGGVIIGHYGDRIGRKSMLILTLILGIPADLHDVTALLLAWRAGDERALERIVPRVHDELQKIARRYMRGERRDHSLQATALLDEAYLRLVDARRVNRQNRAHFLAMSARITRRVLVEAARARRYRRRGADACRVTLAEDLLVSQPPDVDIIALSEALDEFAQIDQRKSRVAELAILGDSRSKRPPKRWASRPRPWPGTGESRARGCAVSLADADALFRFRLMLEFAHLLANQILSIHRCNPSPPANADTLTTTQNLIS